jgi:hypothetical protein
MASNELTERVRATDRPVFTVGGETFTWTDVVAAARSQGDWQVLEGTTAEGLACARRLTASGEELDPKELAEAESVFRRRRRLLSGDETVAWLDRYGLSLPEWRDYLRRVIARGRWADDLAETVAKFPVADEEVATAVWAEAVCSGLLDEAADRLAADAALAAEVGESAAGARHEALRRIADAARRARKQAATEEAIEHEIEKNRLEWLRIEGDLVLLPSESMAREVVCCVRDDGRSLAEMAAECGAEPRPLTLYMGEIPVELSASLLSAVAGDLVGPFAWDGCFALFHIDAAVRPTSSDPDVRRKAEEHLEAQATARAIAANVSWHVEL